MQEKPQKSADVENMRNDDSDGWWCKCWKFNNYGKTTKRLQLQAQIALNNVLC